MQPSSNLSAAEQHFSRYRHAFLITDIGMLLYWIVTAGAALGLLNIPREYLYSDYDNPVVVAWNWSFFALDMVLCVTGIYAFLLFRERNPAWRDLAIMAAVTTSVAGLMAISYWAIRREFDPAWWLPNLAMFIWPILFLVGLMRLRRVESIREQSA